jgi:hypothetical protein
MASGHAVKLTAGDDLGRDVAISVNERRGNAQVGKLPDADDGAHDEQTIDEGLKKTAFFFFRPNEQSVSRFPNWIEGFVCFHRVALSNAMPMPPAERKFQISCVQALTNDSQFREARNLFRGRDQAVPILGRNRDH